jgi:hypothetical protein
MQAFRQQGRSVPGWDVAAAQTSLGRPRLALQRAVPGASVAAPAGAA